MSDLYLFSLFKDEVEDRAHPLSTMKCRTVKVLHTYT